MSYRRILVATDGSATARRAEQAARRLATAFEAELVIVHALEDPPRGADPAVERAAQEARAEGITVVTAVPKGKPAESIIELADRRDADLVILGNVGMERRLRGSVPDTVCHGAPCDVLIVQTVDGDDHTGYGAYRRVLVATDGSSTADRAVRKGMRFASGVDAEPVLLYVGHPATGRNVLEDTIRQLGDVSVRPVVRRGDPADEIVAAARDEDADLVVVGSKGMTGPRLKSVGAVPNKVSHKATTDVLIAKTYMLGYDDVHPGEGAIVEEDGRKVAVYKAEDGTEHVLSARCQHLGCTVGWNPGDRTWDCPCHGSRYAFDGRVIKGPATRDLDPAE